MLMKNLIIAVLIFLASCGVGLGACTGSSPNWSSSLDASSVQTCIANASPGDIITLASGTATWTSGVTINKGVTVVGAGPTSTVITTSGTTLFNIVGNGSGNYRVSNIGFTGSGYSQDIAINGSWTTMRIDHINSNTSTTKGIWIGHSMVGQIVYHGASIPHQKVLIDHYNYSGTGQAFFIWGRGYKAWIEDDGLGTDKYV